MRRKAFITIALTGLLVGLIVAPAAAKKAEPVGGRINVLAGAPVTYPAGEPFHVVQGWLLPSGTKAVGVYDFELEVDGSFVDEDTATKVKITTDGIKQRQLLWLHNFAAGLAAGTYEFTGTWYAPCADAGLSDPCPDPNARVAAFTRTLTVSFTASP